MSQCPFANFPNMIDPVTYENGMPYDVLKQIRESGPIHYMEGSYQDVPYWLVTGRDEIDFISKNPALFSSEQRTALADEHSPEDVTNIHRHMIINMDPPRQLKYRKIVRAAFTPSAVDS
jgi:cytochrome P450